MSDVIMPVIIPVNTSPKLCPKCGKPENKQVICKHCGYEYVDEPLSDCDIFVVFISACVVIWLLITVIYWFADNGEFGDHQTLWQIIVGQWEWLKALRLW